MFKTIKRTLLANTLKVLLVVCIGMKVIRHAGVDSRMIVLGQSRTATNDPSLPIVTSMQPSMLYA